MTSHENANYHSSRYGILLAAGAIVAACSSSPNEATGTVAAAVTQTETGVFTGTELAFAESLTNLWGSSLPFSNGQIEFIPSPCGTVDLGSLIPSGTFSTPTSVVSTGNVVCPTYTASLTGFSVPSFLGTTAFGSAATCPANAAGTAGTVALTTSGVQATIALTGNLHLAAGTGGENLCPSGDVEITSGTITVTLAWQSATQRFKASVVSNLQYNAANCWGGLCNSILASGVGNLNGELETELANTLNTALSNSTTASGIASSLYAALAAEWNLANQGVGDAPWSVVPGTVQYGTANGGEFTFEVSRTAPPAAPGCKPAATCSSEFVPPGYGTTGTHSIDTVSVTSATCASTPTVVQELVGGAWVALGGFVSNPSDPVATGGVYDIQGGVGSVEAVRACTTTAGGTTCDAPTNVTVASCCAALTCGGGLCGSMADGCGGTIACGTCAKGEFCSNNECSTCAIASCGAGETFDAATCKCIPEVKICLCGGTYPACEACK